MQPYQERRVRAMAQLGDGVAIFPSARATIRTGDTAYPFRQESDFFYLTGFNEPDCVLVLAPGRDGERSTLFLRQRDPERELWDGARLGVENAAAALAVDAAYPIEQLAERLPEYLLGAGALHYRLNADAAMDRIVLEALGAARERSRLRGKTPHAFVDPALVVHRMRSIKSEQEIEILQRAADITRQGFLAAIKATRPGRFEYEIQAIAESRYRLGGAQALAYESIVAGGDNATTLHYVANRDRLQAGTLLLMDSGCELDCYATDVTRTWPVDGQFTPEQRAIYEIVLAAQTAAIAQVRPDVRRNAFHEAAAAVVTEGLLELGFLSGSLEENVEQKHYRTYFMHGTGHWLGLDVHDAGAYRDDDDEPLRLAPGMVTTVEPGVYIRRDLDVPEAFKGIGVRIEDDILVTADGNRNLTAAIPRQVEELEAIAGSESGVLVHAR